MLNNKKILIGITGSIAAYKLITLVRLLIKEGAEVKVILTNSAKNFVSPLVLSTLSKNPVLEDLFIQNEWANHVQLGRWADVFIIAPLTCNSLAKMANGLCDNLLMATYLSATCPIVLVPAMDEDMWKHPSTKNNIDKVTSYNNLVISVGNGELASGLFGEGRMAEPEEILTYTKEVFFRTNALKGKKVLVTAGPTHEPIDPVRYISNHSSGKMGFALAEVLYENGAEVTLISGPTHEKTKYLGINKINIVSAQDMYDACLDNFINYDIIVMSAAVADYTLKEVANEKIKKKDSEWAISLIKTKDVLLEMGKQKRPNQFLVGFALETNNEKQNALEKLQKKNLNCIVLNSLNDDKAGFGFDTNKVTIIDKTGDELVLPLKPKREVAEDIANFIILKTNE